MKRETIEKILPTPLRGWFNNLKKRDLEGLQEIRLRVGKPLIIYMYSKEYYVSEERLVSKKKNKYVVTDKDIKETLEFISNYSLYAFEDELRNGYITIDGGHRVGLSGKVVVENHQIKNHQVYILY